MIFRTFELDNGLRIIGEERSDSVGSAIGFFVRTGSRDEGPELSGVSHFLEHMMFKGTNKRNALELNYALAEIGAQANAFTSEESTVYYAAILPEYFEQALEILCDMLRPLLDENEFNTEKKVILEEIALYQDRPTHLLFETALREYFHNHPAGNPVLGTSASVKALTRAQMYKYFSERYVPNNMILAASGNFSWERLCSLAKTYCGDWHRGDNKRELSVFTPNESSKIIHKPDLQCCHLAMLAPGPAISSRHRYSLDVLTCILGDSTGSRTYWELVDNGIADSASIDLDDMEDNGLVYGYVSSTPEKLGKAAQILESIMVSPCSFSEDDLDFAKTKISTRMVLQAESSMRRLMSIGLDWLHLRKYLSLEDELNKIKAVSRQSIVSALERYPLTPTTTIKLVPS